MVASISKVHTATTLVVLILRTESYNGMAYGNSHDGNTSLPLTTEYETSYSFGCLGYCNTYLIVWTGTADAYKTHSNVAPWRKAWHLWYSEHQYVSSAADAEGCSQAAAPSEFSEHIMIYYTDQQEPENTECCCYKVPKICMEYSFLSYIYICVCDIKQ